MLDPGDKTSSAIADVSGRHVSLFCRDAIVQLADGLSDSLTITMGANGVGIDRELMTRTCSGEPPLLAELRSFVDYVNGGIAPKSTISDAVTSVSLIETIYNTLNNS